jgi:hypothetical protein
VPQFFRFNQHHDLEITFYDDMKIEDRIEEMNDPKASAQKRSSRDPDVNFSHLFKELKSEYLIDGDDGNYVKMECSTWLDMSADESGNKSENHEWKTDLSLFNTKDARTVPFMKKLEEAQAS